MLPKAKVRDFAQLENICFCLFFSENKLIADKTQNIFYRIAEHSGCIKYSLNKLNLFKWLI